MTDFALNPFKKGKKTEVEGVRKVEVEGDSELKKVLEQYNLAKGCQDLMELDRFIPSLDNIVLPNKKIQQVLDYLAPDTYKENCIDHYVPGMIVSALIQDSYDAGNNNFTLHVNNSLYCSIGRGLKAKRNGPELILNIYGNVGDCLGKGAYKLILNLEGNAGSHCGESATGSVFNINGNVNHACGRDAYYSMFIISGNAEHYIGQDSIKSEFIISGDVDYNYETRSRGSIFKTTNMNTYKKMTQGIIGKYNEIKYMDVRDKNIEAQDRIKLLNMLERSLGR